MRKRTRSVSGLLVLLATLMISMIVAHGAGGGIEDAHEIAACARDEGLAGGDR